MGNCRKCKEGSADLSVQELKEKRDDNNSSLFMRLREDTYAERLLQVMC